MRRHAHSKVKPFRSAKVKSAERLMASWLKKRDGVPGENSLPHPVMKKKTLDKKKSKTRSVAEPEKEKKKKKKKSSKMEPDLSDGTRDKETESTQGSQMVEDALAVGIDLATIFRENNHKKKLKKKKAHKQAVKETESIVVHPSSSSAEEWPWVPTTSKEETSSRPTEDKSPTLAADLKKEGLVQRGRHHRRHPPARRDVLPPGRFPTRHPFPFEEETTAPSQSTPRHIMKEEPEVMLQDVEEEGTGTSHSLRAEDPSEPIYRSRQEENDSPDEWEDENEEEKSDRVLVAEREETTGGSDGEASDRSVTPDETPRPVRSYRDEKKEKSEARRMWHDLIEEAEQSPDSEASSVPRRPRPRSRRPPPLYKRRGQDGAGQWKKKTFPCPDCCVDCKCHCRCTATIPRCARECGPLCGRPTLTRKLGRALDTDSKETQEETSPVFSQFGWSLGLVMSGKTRKLKQTSSEDSSIQARFSPTRGLGGDPETKSEPYLEDRGKIIMIPRPGAYQLSYRANMTFASSAAAAAAVSEGRTYTLRLIDLGGFRTDAKSRPVDAEVLGGKYTAPPLPCCNPSALVEYRVGAAGARLQLEYIPIEGVRTPKVDSAVLQILRIGD